MSDLLDVYASNVNWHLSPCAEVRVGEHVTRYVRRGTGPSVVLLGVDANALPVWRPLVDSLSVGHRLVMPQPPVDGVDPGGWLREFIEGIGLSEVVVIAGGASTAAAIDVATSDEFTVRKLVLLGTTNGNGSTPSSNGQAIAHTARTLLVPPEWSVADAVQRIEGFITDR